VKLTRKERLALLLQTAAEWHSSEGGGIHLLSLSSTRTVHTERHRAGLIGEIRQDLRWTIDRGELREARRLLALWMQVAHCPVGREWLTFDENNRLNDRLYERGLFDAA
jgi:hypothetical protein